METLVRRKWPFKKTPSRAQLGRDMGRSARSVKGEYLKGKVTLLGKDLEPYASYSAEKGHERGSNENANRLIRACRHEICLTQPHRL
jgi:hypothetical protein